MKKDELSKYLSGIRVHYATYHNHKETSSWAAVLLFALLVFQVSSVVHVGNNVGSMHRLMLSGTVVFLAVVIFQYVATQTKAKQRAADYVAACFDIETDLIQLNEEDFSKLDYSFEKETGSDSHSELIFPEFLRKKANKFFSARVKHIGVKLDSYRYALIIFLAIVTLVRIWVPISV